MKLTSALIAFTSTIALATAASAQLGGGLVGGASGQLGGSLTGGVTGMTGGLTGSGRATAQGAVNAPSRVTRPAVNAGQSVTTGAGADTAAQAGNRRVNAQGAANAAAAQQNASPGSAVNATGALTGQGGVNASVDKADTDDGASNGRVNRQGPANASATGVANANANAGLATATAPDLTMIRAGQTVRTAAGATLGVISKVERSADGTVRNVLVAGADGQKKVTRLAPDSLSLSGDVVTTTAASAGAEKR
jgi:hypothetical protein